MVDTVLQKPKQVPVAAIENVVRQIVVKFHPQQVILFGSYAYGMPQPESDVDLLVVMNTEATQVQQAVEISRQIEYSFGLDLMVYTPQALSQRIGWGDSFLKEIVSRGKMMYESTDA